MIKRVWVTCLFCVWYFITVAQYFQTGEDPACLRWRQIQTPDFQLIYPEEFEGQAQRMASCFEKVYAYGSATMHHKPRKISIIFHTRTIQSNGLVGWAPRRMELFTPPHQAIYAQDWLEQLAIHEFRHVVQVDKIHSEIPAIIRLLLGEQGDAFITGIYLPFWFIEGDAVVTETALSTAGRGRLPSFLMEHRAQLVEKGKFSFDKAVNGSFRNYVPNHYNLGYLLVGESRARYGSYIWSNVLDQLARKPYSLNPVNRSLKKSIGMNQERLYTTIFDSLQSAWIREDRHFTPDQRKTVTKSYPDFREYRFNHILPGGEIVSLKSDYDHLPGFIKIDSLGNESVIFTPGKIPDESVGYRNNLIIWSELVPDIRWSHSGKTLLRIYNVVTRQLKTIIPDYKGFAPSISPDEHNVAVVEADFGNKYYLSVYDAGTGKLSARYQTPGNRYLFSPVWKDNEELYVIVLTEKGKEIAAIRPFTGELRWLSNPQMGEIKHLVPAGDQLYFTGTYAGKDELYSLHIASGEVKRLVTARFGLDYPALTQDSKKLIFSDYTSNGYRLSSLDTDKISADYICNVTKVNNELADKLALQEPGIVNFSDMELFPYPSKPYRKGLHLFNFHSWGPFSLDAGSYTIQPGFSMASQNKLGTAQTTLGYRWNIQEKEGQYYIDFEYRGFYPVISVSGTTGKRNDKYYQITVIRDQAGKEIRRDTSLIPFSWKQSDLGVSVKLPLNFSRGRYSRLIQPSVTYQLSDYSHTTSTPSKFIEGISRSVSWRLGIYDLLRQAYRDLQPRWGYITDISYRHSPFGGPDRTKLAGAELLAYLPGFFLHHGFSAYGGIQMRTRGIYRSYNDVNLPAGWTVNNLPGWWSRADKDFIMTYSARYTFPVLYPDWNLSKLVYCRRVKAALFYDLGWIQGEEVQNGRTISSQKESLTSFGTDITADLHLLRFYAPFDAGMKIIYLPAIRKTSFQLLLSVDFTSL
jgi:hypothetical protein